MREPLDVYFSCPSNFVRAPKKEETAIGDHLMSNKTLFLIKDDDTTSFFSYWFNDDGTNSKKKKKSS